MGRWGPRRPVAERFWAKVDKSGGPDACWPWTASLAPNGYGKFRVGPVGETLAHRWAYKLTRGPIPEGLEVDHVKARGCHRRDCCNPAHLEAVTGQENQRRRRLTHCKRGHEFTTENTYFPPKGSRQCRQCQLVHEPRKPRTKITCPQGHPLSGSNLYVNRRGFRCCRTCSNAQSRAYKQRKKEGVQWLL